jgi:hypothetical protein
MPLAAPVTMTTLPANGWLADAYEVTVNFSLEMRVVRGGSPWGARRFR